MKVKMSSPIGDEEKDPSLRSTITVNVDHGIEDHQLNHEDGSVLFS